MSIRSQITRLQGNIRASLQAVAEKKVTVSSAATSDELPDLIRQIVQYEPGFVVTYKGTIASASYDTIYKAASEDGFDNILLIHSAPLLDKRIFATLLQFDEDSKTALFTSCDGEYATFYTVDNGKNVTVTTVKITGIASTTAGLILTGDGVVTASTNVSGASLSFTENNGAVTMSVSGATLNAVDNGIGNVNMSIS